MSGKIAIGSDHGGFLLKEKVKKVLISQAYDVEDMGCNSLSSCDYPDYGFKVASLVASDNSYKGVLICKTGIGMSIVANKVHGIRAALCYNEETAKLSRSHNNANILVMSSKIVKEDKVQSLLDVFFNTEFEGGRHLTRLNKIDAKGE